MSPLSLTWRRPWWYATSLKDVKDTCICLVYEPWLKTEVASVHSYGEVILWMNDLTLSCIFLSMIMCFSLLVIVYVAQKQIGWHGNNMTWLAHVKQIPEHWLKIEVLCSWCMPDICLTWDRFVIEVSMLLNGTYFLLNGRAISYYATLNSWNLLLLTM